jgi:hypothetical protein
MAHGPLVGITGRARSGKDTFAGLLQTYLGGTIYSMADPIRNMLRGLGINMSDPYWQVRKEESIPIFGKSPRELMQTLGTEWGRQLVNPQIWVILAHRERMNAINSAMIVPDIRFDNEANWVRKSGGLIVRIERDNLPSVKAHSSEIGILMYPQDIVVKNNGTLEDLQIAAREVFYAIAEARNNLHSADSPASSA